MNKFTFKPLAGTLDEYEVISFLPFQSVLKSAVGKPSIKDEDVRSAPQLSSNDTMPYWVQQLNEIGRRGEIIALNYLKTKYKNVAWVADQTKLGYDISADNELFEIKTTERTSNSFFISHHELRVAYEKKARHHLMFIKIRQTGVEGYIFDDIFETFSIDVNELFANAVLYKNSLVTMTSKNYMVELDENFIESAEVINLLPFCN